MSSCITTLNSSSKTVDISRNKPTVMIGERINPTGRKIVLEAIENGNFDIVRQDAVAQVEAGARVLDVNAGVPGADEEKLLPRVIEEVMSVVDVPLCIDTANPAALEAALKQYPGKALINSTNGEERNLKVILPLAKRFGAAIIGLCMDESGIPGTAEARVAVAKKIIDRARNYDIPIEDIVIDPLALTMSSDHTAGQVTLETMALVRDEFGVNITLGASNVSFGLPDRKFINATFIALGIQVGLTCPITNPLVTEIRTAVMATDLALGKDQDCMRWIKDYRSRQTQ